MSLYLIKNFFLQKPQAQNTGTLLSETCLKSKFFNKSNEIYSIEGCSKVSLFRDIIILKEKSEYEKGVILVKYTPAFDAFYFHFDFEKIRIDYYLILEPSWAGVCDPSLLLFWRNSINKEVIVQAIEPTDYKFIEKLGGNFVPIDIGSSDWVDKDIFNFDQKANKIFDIVMVSNWARHKNHSQLFKALSKTKKRLNVLLIGFQAGGRTKDDILKEIQKYKLKHINIIIKENIPAEKVAYYLNRSKVYILLSKKEGPNKAIIEAFFVNVPAILYENFIGGAQMRINQETGVFSSFRELNKKIEYTVANYNCFSPRKWILKNSGSMISTNRLNRLLKSLSRGHEIWTKDICEKVNNPNLNYKSASSISTNRNNLYSKYKMRTD